MSKINTKRAKVINEIELIQEELEEIGQSGLLKIISKNNEYLLINKILTFADIPTFGKYSYKTDDKLKKNSFSKHNIEKRVSKNRLFYFSNDEMAKIEWKNRSDKLFFCQTKQSNISLPNIFYEFLNIGGNRNYKINKLCKQNNYNVRLVNNSIEGYFDKESTNKLFNYYNRDLSAQSIELNKENEYTELNLSIGQHGIGKKDDKLFHNLRGNMFAKDSLYLLLEKVSQNKFYIYLIPYRNTCFYKITKQAIPPHTLKIFEEDIKNKKKSREGQNKWRKMLADLYIVKSGTDDNMIKCPFTDVMISYPDEFTLMRASHIKDFKSCTNVSEAYNTSNGFLLTANADALFDKHLISVNPKTLKIEINKNIRQKLIKELKIKNKVDDKYVNKELIDFLKYHYKIFENKNNK